MPNTAAPREDLLVWIDLEMTGLDPERERIIEVATLITDNDLNLVAEGPVLAVHQPDSLLAAMDEWNQKTHGESGLVERVKQSRVDTAEAERQTLEFLRAYVAPGSSPMCGNSVHQDRRFLEREMPELLGMCDRIHVMNEGRFVGELTRAEASQERIMALILQSEGKAA